MNYTALIIEDEPLLARNMMLYLQRHELECHMAGSGEEGLLLVDEVKPDVVVLDHNLPGKTGLSVLAELRAKDAQMPVVMVTGHGSEQVAVDAMKLGAFDYLIKPVSLHQLKQVLDRAVQQQRQASELRHLRTQSTGASAQQGSASLLGSSSAMKQVRHRLAQLVDADRRLTQGAPAAVLIHGETGTGKELVARALHFDGPRSEGPFVEINCASLPSQLVESELFGHERGAFTDAKERRIGLVEAADGGTLFLDEVGELELATQAKLLKLLEDRRVRRLGSVRDQEVDVRVVAATNRPLEAMVQAGTFRGDLFFRLGALRVDLPPLRAREGDATELARVFLARTARRYGKPDLRWSEAALAALASYGWPGNVRELNNVVEQSVILCTGAEVGVQDLSFPTAAAMPSPVLPTLGAAAPANFGAAPSLPDAERQMLEQALLQHRWNVTQAARALGISRDTLRYRIDKFGLKPSA